MFDGVCYALYLLAFQVRGDSLFLVSSSLVMSPLVNPSLLNSLLKNSSLVMIIAAGNGH